MRKPKPRAKIGGVFRAEKRRTITTIISADVIV
jgi:hypothetical protein